MIIARWLAVAAAAAGVVAWIVYLRADLVLSHYDAKAHLVVARRVIDSITPGWQQFGGVWLPLPHVMQALPVQSDPLYRSGAFASMVSIACLAVTVYAFARLVMLTTGSRLGAAVSATLLALNPNLLYLHVTPMTEPILLASVSLAVLWLYEWVLANRDTVPGRLGWTLFAATLSRYEAWLVLAAAIAAALFASHRFGASGHVLVRRAWRLAMWPAAAVVLFLLNSRITTGAWLVTGGFYVPDPDHQGQLARSLVAVWWGTHQLSTRTTEIVAVAAALICLLRALVRRADAPLAVPLAFLAASVLPLYGFYQGHPFRVRYMVPLVAACALLNGVAVGMLRRHASVVLAGLVVGISLLQAPPWRGDAPMLVEAQWDVPAAEGRRQVTACLVAGYRGEKILASMGSLAHYMQELSHVGLDIADFVHEGNGVIWELATETGPQRHVGWMLVEEVAEGGDVLAQRIRRDPAFARGMDRACEGGGVALYAGQRILHPAVTR